MENFFKKRQKRTTRHGDGWRPRLTGMGDAGGLVLGESRSEEELPPPPPPTPRRAIFASVLEEAKIGSNDAIPAQPNNKGDQAAKGQAAQPDRIVRKPQLSSQTVTSGLMVEDEKRLREREADIEGVRIGVSTAVPMCKKEHIRLICHWSYSDPTNRKKTWRLEQINHRNDSNYSFEDNQKCECKKSTDLLDELGSRMINDFEQHEERKYNMKEKKENGCLERVGGRTKKRILLHAQLVRELSSLVIYATHDTSISGNAGGRGKKDDTGDRKDKGNKGGKGKRYPKEGKDIVMARKEAQKAAELARLRRLMEDKAQRKVADQQRVERRVDEQTDAQRMANGAVLVNDTVLERLVGSDQAGGSQPTTRQQSQALEYHLKIDNLTPKENRIHNHHGVHKHRQELDKQARPKKRAQPELTEEEQEALRSIQAAELEEVDQLDQAEGDDEDRQQQLVAQQEETGGAVGQEEDSDVGLEATMLDALENASPEPESARRKPAKDSQKKTIKPKLSNNESDPDEPQESSPPPKERKRRPKPRARPVVEDSSEESDNIKAPQLSKIVKSKPKTPPKIRKPTVPFAEYVIAKAASKSLASRTETPKKSDKSEKTHKVSEKPETTETMKFETNEGKKLKSEGFIAGSDLEDDATDDVDLPTDKLHKEKVSAEITNADITIIPAEQDGNVVEATIETTTVAVEVQQQDGSTERTEVTETTTVNSDPFNQGDTTVKYTTHTQSFNTPANVSGADTIISTPPFFSIAESHSTASSPRKRQHSATSSEPQCKPGPESEDQDALSSSKKRKTTPPNSLVVEDDAESDEPSTPPLIKNVNNTLEAGNKMRNSPPSSPGAVTVASSASSSSGKKRKYMWLEDNGEVTSSLGGTKRARRVQSSSEATSGVLVLEGAEAAGECEGSETRESEKAQAEGEATAQDAESAEAEGEDSDDLNSLFDE